MSPHFEALVVFVVMSILVTLFAWIYFRDPQPKIRLWMYGWGAIFLHFAAPLVGERLSLPNTLVVWTKIATLEVAATCFLLSVSEVLTSSRRKAIAFLGSVALPSLLYLTAMVVRVPYGWIYPALLIVSIGATIALALQHHGYKSRYFYLIASLVLSYGGLAVWHSLQEQPRTGLYFYLSLGFGLTGIAYGRHFRRFSPGVVFTSLSFIAWGLVWPVATILGSRGPAPSSFVWDLPKYFVAFGMIMTLFETHAEVASNSAREYEMLFEDNLAAVFVSTEEGRLLDCNSAFLKMYGFKSKAEAQASSTRSFYAAPTDRDTLLAQLKNSGILLDYECRYRRSDGTFFWALIRATWRTRGNCRVIQGTLIDITVRKQAEFEIRESEERFATIFRESPIGCAILSLDGVFLDVNEALTRMLKRPTKDIIGKTGLELGFWETPGDRKNFYEKLCAEGSIQKLDMKFKDAEGSHHEGLYFASIIRVGARDCILGMQLDQTEQRKLEATCLQAQKMESLGRLAGGVAHDFNNVLGVIAGFAELLGARLTQDEVSKRYCSKIIDAANRANGLTRQLLTFSRREISRPSPLKPARVVRELASILSRLIGEDIELILELQARGTIIMDPTQFEQIIFNVAVNARDAMPHGGQLRIEMEDVSHPVVLSTNAIGVGPYVAIRIRDTGVGMDETARLHAFEPFYTTKDVGAGTGLGLATVYGIVQQCSGDIGIDSCPGKGTQITIMVPATHDAEPEPVHTSVQEVRNAIGTILLVEDESDLREASADYLSSLGYSVICAGSGVEALTLARNNAEINLVISDVVMPKMNGRELVENLREFRPHMQVLFISGYADDVVLRAGISSQGTPFLQKPYSLLSLGMKVHELLVVENSR